MWRRRISGQSYPGIVKQTSIYHRPSPGGLPQDALDAETARRPAVAVLPLPPNCLDAVMRPLARRHLVVADHADRAICLEHGEEHVLDACHAVLPQRLQQLVPTDA